MVRYRTFQLRLGRRAAAGAARKVLVRVRVFGLVNRAEIGNRLRHLDEDEHEGRARLRVRHPDLAGRVAVPAPGPAAGPGTVAGVVRLRVADQRARQRILPDRRLQQIRAVVVLAEPPRTEPLQFEKTNPVEVRPGLISN